MSSPSPGQPDGTHSAFFYGTLMAPEVFFSVCYNGNVLDASVLKSLHEFKPALLKGFCRRRVKSASYPGIVSDSEHDVRGMYVTGLTDANMYHLDVFEGEEYERRKINVQLIDDGKGGREETDKVDNGETEEEVTEVEGETYVFLDSAQLEDREWDFEEFRRTHMKNWARGEYV